MLLIRFCVALMLSFANYSSVAFTVGAGNLARNSKRMRSSPLLRMTSTSPAPSHHSHPIPVTILSGFLGAGKTTFLQHTLANRGAQKFGLIVNDMATVNIDAKQIRQQTFDSTNGITTMELQDGCVCCNLSEDMFASLSNLLSVADLKKETYDHIVVECSGIAEPRKLRDAFQAAEDYKMAFTKKLRLDTLITLVDATVFLNLFGTTEDISKNRQLAYNEKKDPQDKNTYIEMDGSDQRVITDLLLEQVECADIVLVNKCDLLQNVGDEDLVRKVISSINPNAKVYSCVKGGVADPVGLIGSAQATGAADWGILDEHRKLIEAVQEAQIAAQKKITSEECHVASCADPTHHHGHSHEHRHAAPEVPAVCDDSACKDPSHNHDHSHRHGHGHAHAHVVHNSASCIDPPHKHDHSHTHSDHDPATCTDPTHNHDHSHGHSHSVSDATTAEQRFGITSFVYKRRRPFHPLRFAELLKSIGQLSVTAVAEMNKIAQVAVANEDNIAAQREDVRRAKRAILRSKGFVWMSTSTQAAYFLSQAGQFLDLLVLGRWWSAIDEKQWPADVQKEISVDFDGPHGDRRQEMVFIGQFGKRDGMTQKELEGLLDACLLSDNEMREYETVGREGDEALKAHFAPGY